MPMWYIKDFPDGFKPNWILNSVNVAKPRCPVFKAIHIYVSSNGYLKVVVQSEDVLQFSEVCHTLYIQ